MSDLTNKFPEAVDSTMLSAYGDCPAKFHMEYVDNWKLAGESPHLHAGGAFAKGTEMARRAYYIDGKSAEDSVAIGMRALLEAYGDYVPPDFGTAANKTLDRMAGALEYYYASYPLDTDHARVADIGGRKGVEFSFSVPLPIAHPQTGDPILFAGRADAVVDYAGGVYALDEKTTTQLGDSWAKQWDLRGQFTGYAWALREYGVKPAGSIVRGLSILKTKYGTAEVIVPQEGWKIDRWYSNMMDRLEAMIRDFKNGKWHYNLGEACNHYSGCPFKTPCLNPDPQPWLNTYFEQREWKPLERH